MSTEAAIPPECGVGRPEHQFTIAVIDSHLEVLHFADMEGPENVVVAIAVRGEGIG